MVINVTRNKALRIEEKQAYLPKFSISSAVLGRLVKERLKHRSRKILFLFCSVNYFEFRKHFKGKLDLKGLKCMNSTFPSGTFSSFPSIFFAMPVNKHKVFGAAFYSKRDGLLHDLFKDAVIDANGKIKAGDAFLPDKEVHSILNDLPEKPVFLGINIHWLDTSAWRGIFGTCKLVKVPQTIKNSGRDFWKEFDTMFLNLNNIVAGHKPQVLCVFINFDEIMHTYGPNDRRTQELLENVSAKIAAVVRKNRDYEYLFFSDHGQIDQHVKEPLYLDDVKGLFYSLPGGLGRTRYFYSKSPNAFRMIKKRVGSSGIVLKRTDPVLRRIFGFDPSNIEEIGDIVTIGTKRNFPSHGWKYSGEHGGLSLEELCVPYLNLRAAKNKKKTGRRMP